MWFPWTSPGHHPGIALNHHKLVFHIVANLPFVLQFQKRHNNHHRKSTRHHGGNIWSVLLVALLSSLKPRATPLRAGPCLGDASLQAFGMPGRSKEPLHFHQAALLLKNTLGQANQHSVLFCNRRKQAKPEKVGFWKTSFWSSFCTAWTVTTLLPSWCRSHWRSLASRKFTLTKAISRASRHDSYRHLHDCKMFTLCLTFPDLPQRVTVVL